MDRFRPINQREKEEGEKSRIDASLDFSEDNSVKGTDHPKSVI
jgi:hypothetical protein